MIMVQRTPSKKQTKFLSLRLPGETHEKLVELSKMTHMSINGTIIEFVDAAIETIEGRNEIPNFIHMCRVLREGGEIPYEKK